MTNVHVAEAEGTAADSLGDESSQPSVAVLRIIVYDTRRAPSADNDQAWMLRQEGQGRVDTLEKARCISSVSRQIIDTISSGIAPDSLEQDRIFNSSN